MKLCSLFLPSIALGAAALLILPSQESLAFNKLGGNLPLSKRDFRVFNNFADATANDNTNDDPQFPGYDGVELSQWKAYVEWGSGTHGDGSGDPLQGNLGDGGANFDVSWQGNAHDIGTIGDQIVSAISSCGGGTLAFTEFSGTGGWRIRFCDEWTWHDGPGDNPNGGSNYDLQGVGCHEFGHALGLDHTNVGGSTMTPGTTSSQSSNSRSIEADDIAGVQCIYGVKDVNKPEITSISTGGGNVTITGINFSPSNNEVWFTNKDCTLDSDDPAVIVSGVTSSGGGTSITVAIPSQAGPGDLLVRNDGTGHANLSNSYPIDISATQDDCPEFGITAVNPDTVDALIPGTAKTVSIEGNLFSASTTVEIDFVPLDPSQYCLVDDTLITMDMPQLNIGAHLLTVREPGDSDSTTITVVEPSSPVLQIGDGDIPTFVSIAAGVDIAVSSTVGKIQVVLYSDSNVPSCHPIVKLDMGGNFTSLFTATTLVVPSQGWTSTNLPLAAGPLFMTFYSQSIEFGCGSPFPESNLQELLLVP